jgi:hypothetical protein
MRSAALDISPEDPAAMRTVVNELNAVDTCLDVTYRCFARGHADAKCQVGPRVSSNPDDRRQHFRMVLLRGRRVVALMGTVTIQHPPATPSELAMYDTSAKHGAVGLGAREVLAWGLHHQSDNPAAWHIVHQQRKVASEPKSRQDFALVAAHTVGDVAMLYLLSPPLSTADPQEMAARIAGQRTLVHHAVHPDLRPLFHGAMPPDQDVPVFVEEAPASIGRQWQKFVQPEQTEDPGTEEGLVTSLSDVDLGDGVDKLLGQDRYAFKVEHVVLYPPDTDVV